ncbi:MAG TPA: valine--tRNA ligase [Chloroflexota bacterium]|nr:valine--tRNA ligase [Chloroflexota bacterium]
MSEALTEAMAPRYAPADAEQRWYDVWEKAGYFRPRPDSDRGAFVITIPPPNVTGELHMGHALTFGIEDVVARFKRMQGYSTLIVPGTDHAGIATQNVVEKQLAQEGLSRYDLGREAFLDRVWAWKDQYAHSIRTQFRALGVSFDWSRERFTMDDGYVDAVLEFFIRLYDEKQIYRGKRVINWCPRCRSAISDIEVDDVTRDDNLYYVRYPLASGEGDITVATVRPETMLGDVAVAVNPNDERFAHLIGKTAVLPLVGRRLPIIADDMVDATFGTGAVKMTPAHDFADFEVGERHNLPMPVVIGPDARITENGGRYAGLTAEEARPRIVDDLVAGGYLVRTEPYTHNVPTCERCGTILEPLLSEQWFMRMDRLAPPAIAAVENGDVRIIPQRWEKVYLDWMNNIRPWTLSRQLWWGHRIPIYYCADGHATAAKSWPEACESCGKPIERQEEDVLDTWFSSALWPFAALGWPNHTEDLERFYPTSFMNTSSQILYLWIARMIMTGLKFMGRAPFPAVLINATILNKHGQRMSKSLGTGVDPLDLVREFGADALRFGLMTAGSTQQQEIRFSEERVELARNFANKVWNLARAVLRFEAPPPDEPLRLSPEDEWILSRLAATVGDVTNDLEGYELSAAGNAIQDFMWGELADWYLEIAKARLYDENDVQGAATAAAVLWSVLERSVRLLHPYMPFLTEEIWQYLRRTGSPQARALSGWVEELPESIMLAPWPVAGERNEDAERTMELVMEVVRAVRAIRSEYAVPPGRFVPAAIQAGTDAEKLRSLVGTIARQARLQPVLFDVAIPGDQVPAGPAVSVNVGPITVSLPLAELTDPEEEQRRLRKELEDARRYEAGLSAKLSNESFVARAPAAVVERERARAVEAAERVRRIESQLHALRS